MVTLPIPSENARHHAVHDWEQCSSICFHCSRCAWNSQAELACIHGLCMYFAVSKDFCRCCCVSCTQARDYRVLYTELKAFLRNHYETTTLVDAFKAEVAKLQTEGETNRNLSNISNSYIHIQYDLYPKVGSRVRGVAH